MIELRRKIRKEAQSRDKRGHPIKSKTECLNPNEILTTIDAIEGMIIGVKEPSSQERVEHTLPI
jgi:hypothetical protein